MSTRVVLMAGGLGLRLHPLTQHLPKPMLNVAGSKPMLQTIVERFAAQGFRKFTFCLGYKADLIEGYFGNGSKFGVKISHVLEAEPLGTAGALRLIAPPQNPFIVQNADILTDLHYGRLMEAHARSNADATVCLALHQHQVPYGVVEASEDGRLVNVKEKPIHSWLVNAGIYVLNPDALERAPEGRFDMPDLIQTLPHVAVYEIADRWEDIGSFESLERARAGA